MFTRTAKMASLALVLSLAALPMIAGCGGDSKTTPPPVTPPPSTTGSIIGSVSLPAGLPGDLGNARVGVFNSIDNWNADIPAMAFGRVIGTGPSVGINVTNVTPGSYFVEVWQDTDHSGTFSSGDWWGISGTSTWPNPTPSMVMVAAGQSASVSIFLIAIP